MLEEESLKHRLPSNLFVNNRKMRFLLDCGSTVNILPRAVVTATGRLSLRPPRAMLLMFDRTELPTIGIVTGHPLPLWSTQLLACVDMLKLSTDTFETRI